MSSRLTDWNTREEALADIKVRAKGWLENFTMCGFRDDKEVVLEAVKADQVAFCFVSKKLRGNKEIVRLAVSCNGMNLAHADEAAKDDREIVLLAVRSFGWSIDYASDRLKDDTEVVIEAVKQSVDSMLYVSSRLKDLCVGVHTVDLLEKLLNELKLEVTIGQKNNIEKELVVVREVGKTRARVGVQKI